MLTAAFAEAVEFARHAHDGQRRKGTNIPYMSHLLAVSGKTMEAGGDEDLAVAALLHDVVEDTSVSVSDIRRKFGDRVARVVEGCSDYVGDDPHSKPPWLERKAAYLVHLDEADRDVLMVSLADKTHNASTIAVAAAFDGPTFWDRFTASPADTLWYYRAVLEVFQRKFEPRFTHELASAVGAIAAIQQEHFVAS